MFGEALPYLFNVFTGPNLAVLFLGVSVGLIAGQFQVSAPRWP